MQLSLPHYSMFVSYIFLRVFKIPLPMEQFSHSRSFSLLTTEVLDVESVSYVFGRDD